MSEDELLREEREEPAAAASPMPEMAPMAASSPRSTRSADTNSRTSAKTSAKPSVKTTRAYDDDVQESDQSADEPTRRSTSRATPKGYPGPASPPPPPPEIVAQAAAPPPPAPARPQAEAKADKDTTSPAKRGAAGPRAETLVQRADRLFTEGRWVEAAVAYRDLLRQTPNSPDAARWRRRLSAADSAAAASRSAPP